MPATPATTVPAACGCPVASRHSARGSGVWGANLQNAPLDRVPLAPQYPFERPAGGLLQVPERLKEDRQFGGFAYPKTPPHSPLLPRRGGRPRAAPRKGFLNRRFKRVFAYFCRGAKVGRRPGAEARKPIREESPVRRPQGGEDRKGRTQQKAHPSPCGGRRVPRGRSPQIHPTCFSLICQEKSIDKYCGQTFLFPLARRENFCYTSSY